MLLLLIIFIFINLIIQYTMWFCFREPICVILYYLTYVIRYFSPKYANITVGILLFGINLLISCVVSLFTGAGNVIGIANLFSSIFLSIIMLFDYNKLTKNKNIYIKNIK